MGRKVSGPSGGQPPRRPAVVSRPNLKEKIGTIAFMGLKISQKLKLDDAAKWIKSRKMSEFKAFGEEVDSWVESNFRELKGTDFINKVKEGDVRLSERRVRVMAENKEKLDGIYEKLTGRSFKELRQMANNEMSHVKSFLDQQVELITGEQKVDANRMQAIDEELGKDASSDSIINELKEGATLSLSGLKDIIDPAEQAFLTKSLGISDFSSEGVDRFIEKFVQDSKVGIVKETLKQDSSFSTTNYITEQLGEKINTFNDFKATNELKQKLGGLQQEGQKHFGKLGVKFPSVEDVIESLPKDETEMAERGETLILNETDRITLEAQYKKALNAAISVNKELSEAFDEQFKLFEAEYGKDPYFKSYKEGVYSSKDDFMKGLVFNKSFTRQFNLKFSPVAFDDHKNAKMREEASSLFKEVEGMMNFLEPSENEMSPEDRMSMIAYKRSPEVEPLRQIFKQLTRNLDSYNDEEALRAVKDLKTKIESADLENGFERYKLDQQAGAALKKVSVDYEIYQQFMIDSHRIQTKSFNQIQEEVIGERRQLNMKDVENVQKAVEAYKLEMKEVQESKVEYDALEKKLQKEYQLVVEQAQRNGVSQNQIKPFSDVIRGVSSASPKSDQEKITFLQQFAKMQRDELELLSLEALQKNLGKKNKR